MRVQGHEPRQKVRPRRGSNSRPLPFPKIRKAKLYPLSYAARFGDAKLAAAALYIIQNSIKSLGKREKTVFKDLRARMCGPSFFIKLCIVISLSMLTSVSINYVF